MSNSSPQLDPSAKSYSLDQLLTQFGYQEPSQSSLSLTDECPQCARHGLYIDEGVLVCQYCQCEHGGLIDEYPEWRNYGNDSNQTSDPTRCGFSIHPLLVESSYVMTIGYTRNTYLNRLRQLNIWQSMPYHERLLKSVFDRL